MELRRHTTEILDNSSQHFYCHRRHRQVNLDGVSSLFWANFLSFPSTKTCPLQLLLLSIGIPHLSRNFNLHFFSSFSYSDCLEIDTGVFFLLHRATAFFIFGFLLVYFVFSSFFRLHSVCVLKKAEISRARVRLQCFCFRGSRGRYRTHAGKQRVMLRGQGIKARAKQVI